MPDFSHQPLFFLALFSSFLGFFGSTEIVQFPILLIYSVAGYDNDGIVVVVAPCHTAGYYNPLDFVRCHGTQNTMHRLRVVCCKALHVYTTLHTHTDDIQIVCMYQFSCILYLSSGKNLFDSAPFCGSFEFNTQFCFGENVRYCYRTNRK